MAFAATTEAVHRAGAAQPDAVALSWCTGPIRASLAQCAQRLRDALRVSATDRAPEPALAPAGDGLIEFEPVAFTRDGASAFAYGNRTARLLAEARQALRTAHGALVMLAVEGATVVAHEIGTLLERFATGMAPIEPRAVDAIVRAADAMAEYLDELATGSVHQPLRLYPYYRALLESRRAGRIHPAELFFPDLAVEVPAGPSPATRLRADARLAARSRFESGLLRFLRNSGDAQALADLCAAVDALEASQRDTPQRAFWWLALAFFEALRTRAIGADLYAKRLIARLNTQMKHVLEQGAPVPQRLLIDTLFELARAREPRGLAAQAIERFGLAGVVPDDFELPRYGNVDAAALRAARDATAQAKQAWDKAVRGSQADAAAFGDACAALAQVCVRLPAPGLQRVAGVLARTRGVVEAAGGQVPEAASIGIATALMFVEQVLERGARADDPYHAHGSEIAERLAAAFAGRPVPDALPGWMMQLAAAAQDRQATLALVAEIEIILRGAEQTLDAFFRDPSQRAELATLDAPLRQVAGALQLAGHPDAADGARAAARAVARLAAAAEPPDALECERIATGFGALGFYVDLLAQPDCLAGRFVFDAAADVFRLAALPVREALPEAAGGKPAVEAEGDAGLPVPELPPVEPEPVELAPIDRLAMEIAAARASQPMPDAAGAGPMSQAAQDAAPAGPVPSDIGPAAPHVAGFEPVAFVEPVPVESGTDEAHPIELHAIEPQSIELQPFGYESTDPDTIEYEPIDFDLGDLHADASARAAEVIVPPASGPDEELLEIFLGEADEVLAAVVDDAARLRADPSASEALAALRRDFHTLKGSSRMVGLALFGEAGWAMEQVLDAWLARSCSATQALHRLIEQAHREMAGWVAALRCDAAFEVAPQALIDAAARVLASAQDAGGTGAQAVSASAAAPAAPAPVGAAAGGPLCKVFLDEADEITARLADEAGVWRAASARGASEAALRAAHSLVGSSALVGLGDVHDLAAALERFLQSHALAGEPPTADAVDAFALAVEQLSETLHRFAAGRPRHAAPQLVARLVGIAERLAAASAGRSAGPPAAGDPPTVAADGAAVQGPAGPALHDELDTELLPVFLIEAEEYLPAIGDRLRAWAARPTDAALQAALMRDLHTVKGSARMAGAMRLGQIVHEMEATLEEASRLGTLPPELIDSLMAGHDQVLALYETLRLPGAASVAAQPGASVAAQPGQPLVRVRADLLDRMVDEAGEVSIARARLDNEVGTIRQSLTELTENVARLRAQLREIEIQAESQIQARIAQNHGAHAEFDPLEFDRFTQFQEITRMMAESVDDVATVQHNMMRALEEATTDLSRQAQVARDLQQNLMRARMVQFGTVADRLYRVVRRAARDTDRRVNLDLRGASAEIDRGILERMVGPIEHLLRNAVAHGIEPREQRLAAGKPEAGQIVVEARQERNEAVLTFTDDGRGLDLAAIRARALAGGLIRADQPLPDARVAELIFMPGLTTADAITATAGRGVGMDVVRAEVAALGGRIVTDTQAGRGTRFTIHLPLTLAVTQVVLLTAGGHRYAVPAVLVEQVSPMRPDELARAWGERSIDWQGARVPLHDLADLLDLPRQAPVAQRQVPVLVLHSGNQRIALHADHISANQEVVVKNAGPQLARLKGVAGATVLGNGEIVLIVNPVQLAQLGGGAPDAPDLSRDGLHAGELRVDVQAAPTVMVVDDSLTVRKATQRLLAREGYQVMLAKDGVDALRQLQDAVPDVMLVDIEMPRMDGFDLTRNVRADARLRDVPIVMVTSRTADKHRNKAMALGVDAFLGKPYAQDELLGQVAAFVRQAGPLP